MRVYMCMCMREKIRINSVILLLTNINISKFIYDNYL